MSVLINKPQVCALKESVEKKAGFPLKTHSAFVSLVIMLDHIINEPMSETTLERIWGYSTRSCESVSHHTLDVLARFVGAKSWEDFCRKLKDSVSRESEELMGEFVKVSELESGTRVMLGWMPDRIITVRYDGSYMFTVLESQNSSLKPGDVFKAIVFQKNRELYLDEFRRSGSDMITRYVVGQKSGLTLVSVLPSL